MKRIIDAASAISNYENNLQTTTDISLQEEDDLPFGDDAIEGSNIDKESPPPKDGDSPNNITNHSTVDDDGNNTDTDYPSPDDDDINEDNITVSLNADDDVGDNKDINEQLVTNDDDSNERNTDTNHNQPREQKSILILVMSTVDVQETLKNLGNTVVVDKTSVLTAEQCVVKKIFLQ